MEVLAASLLEQGQPLLFLDPHGQSAKKLERIAAGLPDRLRRRVLVIRPADTEKLVSINPLTVPRDGLSDIDWRAKLTSKVGHVSRILLAAWGETDFNSRPRMFTWTTRILKTLGTCGLTLPDAKHFLDVGSALYQSLIRTVPDLMSRHAFEDLADRRPRDVDEQIESTRTRMLGLMENPIIEAMLGKSDQVLDIPAAIDEGLSLIVDLEPCGKLRDEDQAILANLLLTEFVYAVMNMPADQRRLYFVFIDELPLFAQSSGPLLLRAMCEIRKFLVRFVLAHQGTQRFPKGVEDPFLNTIVAQCAVHIIMRHVNPIDAKYFGEILALPGFNPLKVKHVLRQEIQQQVGHDLRILQDRSETEGDSDQVGGGQSSGSTDTDSWNRDSSSTVTDTSGTQRDIERLRDSVSTAKARGETQRSGEGGSSATSRQENSTWVRTTNRSASHTWKQTLVPRLITKEVVTSVQFYDSNEQMLMPASRLASLRLGKAILYVSGAGVADIQFPLAKDPFARTPKFAAKKGIEFRQALLSRSEYESPAAILRARDQFLMRLLHAIDAQIAERQTLDADRPVPPPVREIPPAPADGTTPDSLNIKEEPPWDI